MPAPADPAPAEIPLPPTDRPALDDPSTAVLLADAARRLTAARVGFVAGPLLILGAIAIILGGAQDPSTTLLVVLAVALGLATFTRATRIHLRFGRWLRSARTLLAEHSWRPVPASFVTRNVLEIGAEDQWQARVGMTLPEAVRQVITRTGRVWVVGPDAAGRLVLRIDGLVTPLPAWRLPTMITAQAEPSIAATEFDPVITWAASLGRAQRAWLRSVALATALVVVLFLLMAPLLGAVVYGAAVGLVVLMVIIVVRRWRLAGDARALPALVRAGPWTRVAVEVRPWRVRGGAAVDATGTIQVAGGTVEMVLRRAGLGLMDTMARTGTVWVAGEPAAGKTVAVGFPGYPLLAVARLS